MKRTVAPLLVFLAAATAGQGEERRLPVVDGSAERFAVFGESAARREFFAAQAEADAAAAAALAARRAEEARARRDALAEERAAPPAATALRPASRPITCRVPEDPSEGGTFRRERETVVICPPYPRRDPYRDGTVIVIGPGGGVHPVFRFDLGVGIRID